MKSIVVTPLSIDFRKQDVGNKRSRKITIENTGTEILQVEAIESNGAFSSNFKGKKICPAFPKNATIFFAKSGAKKVMQNEDGSFNIENKGFGIAGTTNSDGKFHQKFESVSLNITSPLTGTQKALDLLTRVEWTAVNIDKINIKIISETGSKTINDIDATLGAWVFNLTADSGSFQDGQELAITVECSLNPDCASTVTVEAVTAEFTAVSMPAINGDRNVAEDVYFSVGCNTVNVPTFYGIEIEYSENDEDWENIGEFPAGMGGASGTITALLPEGATIGTAHLRLRLKDTDILSDVLEIEVVEPSIVFNDIIAQEGFEFDYHGTCNLPVNLRISQAPDPYTDFGLVDTVTVQANGTFSAPSIVGTGGGWRVKGEYIQDTVALFSGQKDFAMSSITNLATSPVSPTENVDFTISCDTNIPSGTITFEYSTNQADWSLLGTGNISSGSAQLTTAKIPTAGSYYVRARYYTSVYSSNLARTVESAFFPAYLNAGFESSFGIWNNVLYAWGNNERGQLGIGSADANNHSVPEAVSTATSLSGLTPVSVSSGGALTTEFTLCITSNGRVHAWGNNTNGRLGDNSTTQRTSPVEVATGAGMHNVKIKKVSAGANHSLALDENGAVWSWGNNTKGQLGDGSTTERRTPIKVAVDVASSLNGKTVIDIASGEFFSMALDNEGNVHTWGWGASGRLGHNNTSDYSKPKKVDAISNAVAVSASGSESHYLLSNGEIWGAGGNGAGSLGDNSTTQRNAPVKMLNTGTSSLLNKTPTAISSYPDYNGKTVITCSDGTIHITGGLNSIKVPTLLSSGTINAKTVILASSGYRHNLVKISEGTLHAQGSNQYGKLGDNSTIDRTLFVKVNDPV